MEKIDTETWNKMQAKILIFFCSIKMSKKTLKFDQVEVNKKEFDASKQPIALNLVNVKKFNGVINTNILGNEVPKEVMDHTCIACISIDSVMKMNKKNIQKFI